MARKLASLLLIAVGMLLPATAHAEGSFGLAPGETYGRAEERDGTADTQAGSHPYQFTFHFRLNEDSDGHSEGGEMRGFRLDLPPGLVGNPSVAPTCPRQSFEGFVPNCAPSTEIGIGTAIGPGLGEVSIPVYNLAAEPGSVFEAGGSAAGLTVLGLVSVKTDEGYLVHVEASNLPLEVTELSVTLWGMPADDLHTPERGVAESGTLGSPSEAPLLPFLTIPATCGALAPRMTVSVDSKLAPGVYSSETVPLTDSVGLEAPLQGCEAVPFSPAFAASPTSGAAESSSGLAFKLNLPNTGLLTPRYGAVAETEPTKTEVTFPVGVTINPSAANGIAGCTSAEYAAATGEAGVGCPDASRLGTLVAKTPLLEEPIEGSVYLAAPHDNQFGSLIAVYLIATAKQRGVLVKQAGEGRLDPVTGQISTTFDHLPPVPYSSLELKLREGPQAPLVTPQSCGEFSTVARFYPFSAPSSPVERTAPFRITSGANGGACASSEAQEPSKPSFTAGTTVPIAGGYSPFVLRVSRADGEQRFSSLQATLPAGLLGKIAGVSQCPESGIVTASSRSNEGGGAQELAAPSCPAGSQVGTVNVSAGAGSQPYYVQGKAYLAGPYKGAPLSLEIVTPAIAGPFDLGSVAVRTALYVNESTAQIHPVSDPLPAILHGVPLGVRTISVQMDRPDFTLNPTNCQAKTVDASITTLTGAIAPLSNPFAVGGCQGLAFEPALKLSFLGQTKRTGNPAVKAVLTQPKGQNGNLSAATVILPSGMFIDQSHINNPCTRVQFHSGAQPGEGCPAKSILGTAKVWSPLLDEPEEGNVYFRSNGGERELPDLAIALRGQIPLELLGFVDSVGKKGAEVRRIRSRFLNLPDAPVSRFQLQLFGGKRGLVQNSKDLCRANNVAKFQLTGQNGKTHNTEPKIQVSCGQKKGGGHKG